MHIWWFFLELQVLFPGYDYTDMGDSGFLFLTRRTVWWGRQPGLICRFRPCDSAQNDGRFPSTHILLLLLYNAFPSSTCAHERFSKSILQSQPERNGWRTRREGDRIYRYIILSSENAHSAYNPTTTATNVLLLLLLY